MEIFIELLIVLFFIIAVIIFFLYKILNNRYNIINIKLTKSEKKLIDNEKKKFDLLIKAIDILNDNKKFDEDLYHKFLNTKLNEISLIELNDLLIETSNGIDKYLSQNEKIINNKKFKEVYNEINNTNITINSTRKYYNENLKEYNKFIKKFPASLFAKIRNLKEKQILKDDTNKKLKILY